MDVESEAFKLIASLEGLHLTSYWDYKQYSIGYGTRSFKNEKITKQEAEKRLRQKIKEIREKYKLEKYDNNIEVALISFAYNTVHIPKGTDWYIKNNYITALKNRMKQYIYAGGRVFRGLVKRRNKEVSLF